MNVYRTCPFGHSSLRCGGTKCHFRRPFVTALYEADGRARQGDKDFGTAALLYIHWDFTVSNLAQIGTRLGQHRGQEFKCSPGHILLL